MTEPGRRRGLPLTSRRASGPDGARAAARKPAARATADAEEALVARAQVGDDRAFEQLVHHYSPRLRGVRITRDPETPTTRSRMPFFAPGRTSVASRRARASSPG